MNKIIIFWIALLVLILPGCEKNSTNNNDADDFQDSVNYYEVIDYRDKYCGAWYFTTIHRSFSMEDESSSADTTYYDGSIWHEKEDTIHINYRENRTLEFAINDTGGLFIDAYYPIHGEFTDENNVRFSLYSGGLGGGSGQSVSGLKKE